MCDRVSVPPPLRVYSSECVEVEFSELRHCGVLGSCVALGAHQAAYHPYHQLHGPISAQLLLAYQCVPRLEVLG
jgi:hypothetical protein